MTDGPGTARNAALAAAKMRKVCSSGIRETLRPALRTFNGMAAVRAHGLVKTFGEGRAARRVLDGAELEVASGEVVAVLGRSGSGKSTLLHLIGGLDRAEAGTIEVAGERVSGASERRLSALRGRRIGFVFQFFHLLPELSGEGNVLLAGRVPGARGDAAVVLADEPTGNLDVEAGAQVLRLLRDGADEGRAVVLVTHERAAAAIADRVLRLEAGRLVAA